MQIWNISGSHSHLHIKMVRVRCLVPQSKHCLEISASQVECLGSSSSSAYAHLGNRSVVPVVLGSLPPVMNGLASAWSGPNYRVFGSELVNGRVLSVCLSLSLSVPFKKTMMIIDLFVVTQTNWSRHSYELETSWWPYDVLSWPYWFILFKKKNYLRGKETESFLKV